MNKNLQRRRTADWRIWVMLASLLLSVAGLYLVDLWCLPYPEWPGQWPSYHNFADTRTVYGIPNFQNVASNLPLLLVGVSGLVFYFSCRNKNEGPCREKWERWTLLLLSSSIALTGVGSGYYHWNPNNNTLFWDRLPMAVVFMSFFALVISERLSMRLNARLVLPLLLAGVGSVLYWGISEMLGQGDLRPYALVQFYPMLAMPFLVLCFPPRYSHGHYYLFIFAFYTLAKALELADGTLFELLGGMVSGHTLKHLMASVAAWFIVSLIRDRRAVNES